jgi:hypothetical protein
VQRYTKSFAEGIKLPECGEWWGLSGEWSASEADLGRMEQQNNAPKWGEK